jgi:polysaccharide biosynthesis transport protein
MMQVDLRQVLNGLRKRWWLAALVMLSAGLAAYLYTDAQPRIYQAQTTLAAKAVPPTNDLAEAIKKTMPTYAQELANKDFWRQVVDDNGMQDVDVNALPGLIKVQPRPDDNSIVMTVDQRDPGLAAVLADRIANAFIERQTAESQDVNPGGNRVVWSITQPADPPAQAYQPRPRLYAAAAALFGLVLGLLFAVALELLDTTLKTPSEVEQYLGMNTLGAIPKGS